MSNEVGRETKQRTARRLGRYVLFETLKPLLAGLGVILVGLLLERVLRLIDLISSRRGGLDRLLELIVNLVPHYLGLTLPAAFFFALVVAITRLNTNTELDAISSAGLSLYDLVRPLIGLGVLLAFLSILIFGFLQPYSRYAYRAILHAVTTGEWDGTVVDGAFTDAGGGFTLSADAVDATGRYLTGVFVRQIEGATEMVTTARSGVIVPDKKTDRLLLMLEHGSRLRIAGEDRNNAIAFDTMTLEHSFPADAAPFRPRGNSDRELTLVELIREQKNPDVSAAQKAQYRSEFHQRLVRAAALPILPLLAFPVGKAAHRTRSAFGYLIGGLILLLFHHVIQLGESLADTRVLSPYLGLWAPLALFAAFSIWAFHRTDASPKGSPFNAVLQSLERLIDAGSAQLGPRKRTPA